MSSEVSFVKQTDRVKAVGHRPTRAKIKAHVDQTLIRESASMATASTTLGPCGHVSIVTIILH